MSGAMLGRPEFARSAGSRQPGTMELDLALVRDGIALRWSPREWCRPRCVI